MSCPFSAAVTPTLAQTNIGSVFTAGSPTNHELMCVYLALHRAFASTAAPDSVTLAHAVYVASLPTEADFTTPCYFSENEMLHLRGTNLYGAVGDRLAGWKAEWEEVVSRLSGEVASTVTWELYLWACTIISSRAFPSSLIDGDTGPNNTPVLFPGVDTLNHRYGQKVTWKSDVQAQTLTIQLEDGVPAGQSFWFANDANTSC